MQIFLQMLAGKTITLDIDSNDSTAMANRSRNKTKKIEAMTYINLLVNKLNIVVVYEIHFVSL